ncbi:acyl-CoA dehydratase activase [Clostridium sp.]|uniref:acyl-CoA dehydratase activase n=1 Tax=Clostridium sp. TaxID=1506 RepID=UPI0039F56C65
MYHMGVDVGSVSTDFVLLDKDMNVIEKIYLRTKGRPIQAVQKGLKMLQEKYSSDEIVSVGTTGSGRHIAAALLGGDAVKNEITTHAIAALHLDREVRTIIEIGGQDSKIITLKGGVVTDFAMNTVCAAGTGSFLDRQAERLEIPIEKFGDYALMSNVPVRIAGRCAVFAESDMIHKQQLGYNEADIIRGLCEAMVRNYLNNVAKGKDIQQKVFFQGGVAANKGIKKAFEDALGFKVYVPEHHDVMGAIGAAIIGAESVQKKKITNFKGLEVGDARFVSNSFECSGCPNRCEVVNIKNSTEVVGCFGDRCGKWSEKMIV